MLLRLADLATGDVEVAADLRLAFLADHRGTDVGIDAAFRELTRAWLTRLTAAGRLHTWLAEEGEVAVGITSVVIRDVPPRVQDPRDREGHLLHVWVDPVHRRRGIARALVGAALDAVDELGLRTATLHTTEAGRPLYDALGFTPDPTWRHRPRPAP